MVAALAAELTALPKAEPLTLHERNPDFEAPGSPNAVEADNRIPTAAPYSEIEAVSFPHGNWVE